MTQQYVQTPVDEGVINPELFRDLTANAILLPIKGYREGRGMLCVPTRMVEPDDNSIKYSYLNTFTGEEDLANPIGINLSDWTLHEGVELLQHEGVEFITIAAILSTIGEQVGMDNDYSVYLNTVATLYAVLSEAVSHTDLGNLCYT